MSLSRNMKKGDLEPPFDPVLYDADGNPEDLTAATSVKVTCKRGSTTVFTSRTATGNAAGQVSMPWQSGDTSTVGRLDLEVEVEWSPSRTQRYPDAGYFVVNVTTALT